MWEAIIPFISDPNWLALIVAIATPVVTVWLSKKRKGSRRSNDASPKSKED